MNIRFKSSFFPYEISEEAKRIYISGKSESLLKQILMMETAE